MVIINIIMVVNIADGAIVMIINNIAIIRPIIYQSLMVSDVT